MNWEKWIIVSFVLFAAFIGTLVVVCVRQEVSLVSKDYYKEELAFQDQIIRLQNTDSLLKKPEISVTQNGLEITFNQLSKIEKGKLVLFCPSNPSHDKKIMINASVQEKQLVSITDMKPGMYHARFSWSADGKEFYVEKIINL